jgi:hypothetical protein
MFASAVAIGTVFGIGTIAQSTAFIFPVGLKLFAVGDKFCPGYVRNISLLSVNSQ